MEWWLGYLAIGIVVGVFAGMLGIGGGLYECELEYLVKNEWAREAEDVLWRRTKCGLHMRAEEQAGVRDWLAARA